MKQSISIVIVHWNTPDLLKKQLQLLSKVTDITVVDNNSEKSAEWIIKEFPHVRLIENKVNRGFAKACNQGASQSRGEQILFLNPDAHITPLQINELFDFANKHQLVAVSPQPQSDNYKKPIPSTFSLLTEFTPLHFVIPAKAGNSPVNRREIYSNRSPIKSGMTLTGGCLLINRKIFEKLGGFDERFFLWFEDSDLTKRLAVNKYRFGFAPVIVEHSGGVSFEKLDSKTQLDMFFFAMNVYAHKHFSRIGQWVIRQMSKRYSKRKILPPVNHGVSLTIPNMHLHLLHEFFSQNQKILTQVSELIVVSSGLSSESLWNFRKKYPNVRFIALDKNRGVASTINIGFRASATEFIGTVNDDTILTSDWIQKCIACKTDKIGALNPLIYKPDGTLESAGVDVLPYGKAVPIRVIPSEVEGSRPNGRNSHSREILHPALAGFRMTQKVDAVNAAVVLYTNQALNKTGIFDERFGSYLEDIDHSLRLSRNGFDNIVVTNAKVIHVGQSTSKSLGVKKQFYDARNWWLVILKNWEAKKFIRHMPSILLERLRNLSGIIKALVV